MLRDSTETPRKLYGDCAETALQMDSQWSRSQSRQSVRVALVFQLILEVERQAKNFLD